LRQARSRARRQSEKLVKEQKDDNIIKLSFERDEKEKKDLSKLKRHDII
jgi:hypothetical protein